MLYFTQIIYTVYIYIYIYIYCIYFTYTIWNESWNYRSIHLHSPNYHLSKPLPRSSWIDIVWHRFLSAIVIFTPPIIAISLTLLEFSPLFIQKFWIMFCWVVLSVSEYIPAHLEIPTVVVHRSLIRAKTYPSNHLEVFPPMAQVDGLAIEEPLEDGFQRWVTDHFTGQHHTLAHRGVKAQRGHHDPGGFCRGNTERDEKRKKDGDQEKLKERVKEEESTKSKSEK